MTWKPRAPLPGTIVSPLQWLGLGQMRRREFITLVGGAAALAPLAARAQQPATPVIGFMSALLSAEVAAPRMAGFREGLGQTGYVEGRNVAVEYYHEGRRMERLPGLAADLARRPVSVIFAQGTVPALAAKAATTTVPIVFITGDDPVARGLVATHNRPGGNVTGVTFVSAALGAKRLQLLRSLAPKADLIGVLADTSPESQNQSKDAQDAARGLAQQLVVLDAATDDDIDAAFATLVQRRAGALLIAGGPFLASRGNRLSTLAARHAIPVMYPFREFAAASGLISYGASFTNMMHQAAVYVGRILRGEKPADLPVVQPTKFDLVINLGTAKALGIDLPPMLLALADDVIE